MKSTPKLDNLSICIHVALKLQIWAHWPRHHAKNQISALTFLNNKSLKKKKTKPKTNKKTYEFLCFIYYMHVPLKTMLMNIKLWKIPLSFMAGYSAEVLTIFSLISTTSQIEI